MAISQTDTLSRKFKHYLLAHLRRQPGWKAYCEAHAWQGKTNMLTRDEINQACSDLGLDKRALYDAYQSNTRDALTFANAGAIVAGEGDEARDETNPEIDAHIEAQLVAAPVDDKAEAVMALAHDFEGKDPDTLLSEALAPLSVHLTPYLQTHLHAALTPFVTAAVQGPRIVTKTVRAPAYSDSAGPTTVNVVERKRLRNLFGFKAREGGQAWKHALDNTRVAVCDFFDAPAVDPDYVWPANFAAVLGIADSTGQSAWFAGDAGVGKTDGAKQYAALTKRPFIRVPFNRTIEPMELLGEMGLVDGKSVWKDRAFTRAFRTPWAVVLLDEPCLLRSGTLAFVQTALDTKTLHLPTGEDVELAEGVMFIVADNSLGVGDESGRYVDIAPVNAAFLDRFAFREEIKFLDPDDETRMISRRTGLTLDAVKPMIAYASLTRENARSGKLTLGLTPRRLLAWARAVVAGVQSHRAFTMCVINGSSPEDLECLRVLAETSLTSEHRNIDALARGEALPAPLPVESATADSFPHDESEIAPTV